MTIMCAYPLSKSSDRFNGRTAYVWFFLIASLFSGGLIPTYLVVKNVHLLNSFWAMIIPCAVPIGNVILMLNFFRGLPKELEEAAAARRRRTSVRAAAGLCAAVKAQHCDGNAVLHGRPLELLV